jgi:hypothetical protein
MTDKPYPDPPRPTIDALDPESATTDRSGEEWNRRLR